MAASAALPPMASTSEALTIAEDWERYLESIVSANIVRIGTIRCQSCRQNDHGMSASSVIPTTVPIKTFVISPLLEFV